MYDTFDGISEAFRKVTEVRRAVPLRCGAVTSLGTFIGADRDTMRLREIVYVKPPDGVSVFVPDDNVSVSSWGGSSGPYLPSKDFGEGWVASPTQLDNLEQNYQGEILILRDPNPAPAEGGPAGAFRVKYMLPYPLASEFDALYMLDTDRLVPCGPPDAYSVTSICEFNNELWVSGWAVAEAKAVNAASTADGFLPSDLETVPSLNPPDPLIPTRGDAGFRLYDYVTERWVRVATPQQVSALRPAIWRRDATTGTWMGFTPTYWSNVRVWGFYGEMARPFVLTPTAYGIMVQAEGYVLDHHPVQKAATGETQYVAHPTYLLEAGGYIRLVGHTAAVGDTGGGIIVIGPRSSWTGPPVEFIRPANGPLVDPAHRIKSDGGTTAFRPAPMPPVHWRGAFYGVWEELLPDAQQFALARICPGASEVLWARRDTAKWSNANFRTYNHIAATPADLNFVRGMKLEQVPSGRETDEPSREFVAILNTLLAQSMAWNHRNAFIFAGQDDGCFAVGFDLLRYPYSKGLDNEQT